MINFVILFFMQIFSTLDIILTIIMNNIFQVTNNKNINDS